MLVWVCWIRKEIAHYLMSYINHSPASCILSRISSRIVVLSNGGRVCIYERKCLRCYVHGDELVTPTTVNLRITDQI